MASLFLFQITAMSDFLDEITLGLSPQDFLEDMEVEELATAKDY